MIRDLATLLAPETPARFGDHFLRKVRFQVRSTDRARAASLLPWPEINRLIEAYPPHRMQLVRSSNLVPPALYRKDAGEGPPRAAALQAMLRQGSTLVLNRIDGEVPSIGRLTAAIERELFCRVWANAYLSFGSGSALKAHYDLHNVLVLQVDGRKRWQSYGIPVPHPVALPTASEQGPGESVWEDILEPGDVLYLPRGEVHAAALDGEDSVHITIGLKSYRGLDFTETIVRQAAENPLLRQDVPIAAGESAISEHEAALKRALHALIDRANLNDCIGRDNAARRLRSLVNLGVTSSLQFDTIVEPAVRRRIALDLQSTNEVEVSIGGEIFRLSVGARLVLDFLLHHGECEFATVIGALEPRLSEPLARDAVSELARHGLVGIRT